MINPPQGLKPLICSKHNQKITSFQQGQPMCQICINLLPGMMSVDQFYSQLKQILLKQNREFEQQHQLSQSLWDSLVFYKTNINQHLEKIVKLIKEQIGITKTQQQYFQSMIEKSNNQQKLIGELEKQVIQISQSNKSFKDLIENSLFDFKQKQSNIDSIIGLLKQSPIQDIQVRADIVTIPEKVQIQNFEEEHQNISNKFEFQIIKQNSMKYDNGCYSFAFNRDNNILAFGLFGEIKIYEFKNGKLQKELQRLKGHISYVSCLYFMKKSNEFISGSIDNQIIVWSLNKNNQYVAKQVLNDHNDTVNCLLMNKKEDLLISGSDDRTIKFWRVQNGSWNCVQTIESKEYVLDLSLNEIENKLISCNTNLQILVHEIQQSDQQWILVQTINTRQWGYKLCFTIGDQFVFQPLTLDYLEIYDYDNLKKQFYKPKQVQIQSCKSCYIGFPCQFIRQLNILTVKHGNYLNIFSVSQDGNYLLMQSIDYQDHFLYGQMTKNGQYLVTWDECSKEIQVRNLKWIQ